MKKMIISTIIAFLLFTNANATEIDITHILKANGIDQQLSKEAPGNEGTGRLEWAKLDLANGKFKAKARMKYKHTWGKVLGKKVGPPKVNFNVWAYGNMTSGPDGKCILNLDKVETSNDLLKALGAIANIFVNVFTLGKENIGSMLKSSSNFDCNF